VVNHTQFLIHNRSNIDNNILHIHDQYRYLELKLLMHQHHNPIYTKQVYLSFNKPIHHGILVLLVLVLQVQQDQQDQQVLVDCRFLIHNRSNIDNNILTIHDHNRYLELKLLMLQHHNPIYTKQVYLRFNKPTLLRILLVLLVLVLQVQQDQQEALVVQALVDQHTS
jgi:hypothetical protein